MVFDAHFVPFASAPQWSVGIVRVRCWENDADAELLLTSLLLLDLQEKAFALEAAVGVVFYRMLLLCLWWCVECWRRISCGG